MLIINADDWGRSSAETGAALGSGSSFEVPEDESGPPRPILSSPHLA
jgi:hypothetical protein